MIGREGEAYFDLVAAANGWEVFKADGEAPNLDRVVMVGGRFASVQVKATLEQRSPAFQSRGGWQGADVAAIVCLATGNLWLVDAKGDRSGLRLDEVEPWNWAAGKVGSLPESLRGRGGSDSGAPFGA